MTIHVWYARLRQAADVWDDGGEQLTGAATSLTEAPLELLGSRVEPHAKAFVDTWAAELRRLATAAEGHATALRDSATMFSTADQLSVQESQELLPWLERTATPGAPGGAR